MSKALSEKLGLYYVIFHTWRSGYVKCWLNGSEQPTMYSSEQFLSFTQAAGLNTDLKLKVQDALSESSVFFWDIEGDQIRPLSPEESEKDLGQQLILSKESVLQQRSDSGWFSRAFGVLKTPVYQVNRK